MSSPFFIFYFLFFTLYFHSIEDSTDAERRYEYY